jgi:hypothetical protein
LGPLFIRYAYMGWTENIPSCKLILAILPNRLCQSNNLFLTNALLKVMLIGTDRRTLATVDCFLWAILYRDG